MPGAMEKPFLMEGGGVVFAVIGEEVDKGSEMRESKAMECRRVFYPFLLSISL